MGTSRRDIRCRFLWTN